MNEKLVFENNKLSDDLKNILEMISYYFYHKMIFKSRQKLDFIHKSLKYLRNDKNPFLYIKYEMQKTIKKNKSNYVLGHEVFDIFLENDDPDSPELVKWFCIGDPTNRCISSCERYSKEQPKDCLYESNTFIEWIPFDFIENTAKIVDWINNYLEKEDKKENLKENVCVACEKRLKLTLNKNWVCFNCYFEKIRNFIKQVKNE